MKNTTAGFVLSMALLLVAVLLGPTLTARSENPVRWEYLTLQYSQSESFDSPSSKYEMPVADVEPYSSMFLEPFVACTSTFDFSCMAKASKGRAHYLTVLGADGWELITIINQSTQYTYQVEMIFKRQM